jgi:hypothetical protein
VSMTSDALDALAVDVELVLGELRRQAALAFDRAPGAN